MKRILFTALLAAVSALSLPAATIALEYSSNPVSLGDTFTMTVNVTDLFAGSLPEDVFFGFGLTPTISDPSKVIFVGATVDSLFIDFSAGELIEGVVLPPLGYGAGIDLTLAILTFQAIGSGYVYVGVSSDLGDPNQGLVYLLSDTTADLTTSGTIDVVPEPAAAWMFAPSLAALLLAARRRRYN
jgi:hypothetical protein